MANHLPKTCAVVLKCPECRAKLTVPDKLSGRAVVCPLCSTRLKIDAHNDVYQVVKDDFPTASALPINPAAPSNHHAPVTVIIKNINSTNKDASSSAGKHLLKVIIGVSGTVAAAAIIAWFGLSGGENKKEKSSQGELKGVLTELKPQPPRAKQVRDNSPIPSDRQVRWANTTYKSTISHVSGKVWTEIDNTTGKQRWELIEQTRTPDYIEFTHPGVPRLEGNRLGLLRIYDTQAECRKGARWEWLCTGAWVKPQGK